ncbi:Glycosyl transferase [Planctomycetes bacterium Pla163]|uniref:Lipid-A-disaccharide synthase n=1 Tax=Rohdeia mirabilis TaxID=2528008 RepID=A0A518CZQ9_9BACT|nr:Glycosyl transferase [Planctomycetes bacterium Pla163]
MNGASSKDPLDALDSERPLRRRARRGLPPALAVALELLRALIGVLVMPLHLCWHALVARSRRAEVEALLGRGEAHADPLPAELDRWLAADADPAPLVFVSCAEISGEIHARRFVERARERWSAAVDADPCENGAARARSIADPLRFVGLGGPDLVALGVRTVGDPVSSSRMGFGVVLALGFYLRLLTDAARCLRDERPDVAVFVDSPALHVPLGRLARRYGVPVVHFVTPQYWGWAPWRARGYRTAVDLALSILPFEQAWFERRRIHCAHVGHPLLDRLARVPHREHPLDDGPVALLPGSRASVIERNLPWMLETLALAAPGSQLASSRFVVALGRADLADRVRELVAESDLGRQQRVDVVVGDLHEVLPTCCSALSVSGTVVLDVAHHRLPMVVIYRLAKRFEVALMGRLLTVPHFASVNLLAGREVVREFGFAGEGPRTELLAALEAVSRPGPEREQCIAGLEEALGQVGDARAVERAAGWALSVAVAPQATFSALGAKIGA